MTHSQSARSLKVSIAAPLATLALIAALASPLPASAAGCPNEQLRVEDNSTRLPDCRAYEMVSPPAKQGADVNADSGRTRAAADGSAASFVSLGGFADVRGTGIATEYVAERASDPSPGNNGWSTHAITPPQEPLSLLAAFNGIDPFWVGEFSPDLSRGVFRSWSPVTDEDPNVVNVQNLYRRVDLRSAGAGSYQLITPCLACSVPLGPPATTTQLSNRTPRFAGASADFGHLVFESRLKLTSDSSTTTHAYEWTSGTLRLAGILPDTACGAPPCIAPGSIAGQGVSSGLRPSRVISGDGLRINFGDTSTGRLYQRFGGVSTVEVSASERTDCADQDPCTGAAESDPGGHQPATFQTASVDGARVFFTTAEQLTDDDTNSVNDLYMWDATVATGSRLTRISVDGEPLDSPGNVRGVMGASDDGRYVYFVASGQLVAGKANLDGVDAGIYVWHDGAVPHLAYVGKMTDPGRDVLADTLSAPITGGGSRTRVAPDGTHMLFVSHSGAGLLSAHGGVDYDQTQCASGECGEMYVYSTQSDRLACASCNPTGAPGTAEADIAVRDGTGSSATTFHESHALSDDGKRVFFTTAEALVPEDANGKRDAYEYDTQTSAVHLISTGIDSANSYFLDASADGDDVFLLTRERLVGWDTDANYDLYDARVGGGFPDPAPLPLPCVGDACRGPFSTAPIVVQAASTAFHGIGDVKAKAKSKVKKCKKGLVRKKARGKAKCVRKKAVVKRTRRITAHGRTR